MSEPESTDLGVLGNVLHKMVMDAHSTHSAYESSLEASRDRAEATLYIIRQRINRLYSHEWIPQPDLVIQALYPGTVEIDAYIRYQKSVK